MTIRDHVIVVPYQIGLTCFLPYECGPLFHSFFSLFRVTSIYIMLQAYKTYSLLVLQVYVDTLVKKAYENWNHVIEYDGKSLVNFRQTNKSVNELPIGEVDYSNSLDHQLPLTRLPVPVPSEPASMGSGLMSGGKNC